MACGNNVRRIVIIMSAPLNLLEKPFLAYFLALSHAALGRGRLIFRIRLLLENSSHVHLLQTLLTIGGYRVQPTSFYFKKKVLSKQ